MKLSILLLLLNLSAHASERINIDLNLAEECTLNQLRMKLFVKSYEFSNLYLYIDPESKDYCVVRKVNRRSVK